MISTHIRLHSTPFTKSGDLHSNSYIKTTVGKPESEDNNSFPCALKKKHKSFGGDSAPRTGVG